MATGTTLRVRPVNRGEENHAIGVVVAAFAADPIVRWVYPDDETFYTYFPPFAVAFAGGSFEHGMALTTEGGEGVALWMPPGVHSDEEAMGAIIETSLKGASHVDDVMGFAEKQSNLHPKFEHMYLPFLAVNPSKQGAGAGSSLLAYSLALCDERGLPAYLEATSARSRALYERHGFEATGEIQFGSSPPMWPMVRQPGVS